MATFKCEGLNDDGEPVATVIKVATVEDAIETLKSRAIWPTSIRTAARPPWFYGLLGPISGVSVSMSVLKDLEFDEARFTLIIAGYTILGSAFGIVALDHVFATRKKRRLFLAVITVMTSVAMLCLLMGTLV